LLAANMLFAGGKRKHKTSASFRVHGLPRKSARHLTYELFTRRNYADEWAAVAWRQAKTLSFHRNNVGLRGRLNCAEGYAFVNSHNEKCANSMHGIRVSGDVFDDTEKVGRLHNNSRDIVL